MSSLLKTLAAILCALSFVSTTQAHPYASAVTNIVLGGSNYVQFILNEGGTTVTVTTYPSQTTTLLGTNVAAGVNNFPLGSDTSFTISCTKVGAGAPALISNDSGWCVWNGGPRGFAVDVDKCAQYGDSFGRVYVGLSGSTLSDSSTPAARMWGMYGLTPDLAQNSFFGGNNSSNFLPPISTNTLTITNATVNGNTLVFGGRTILWTNAVVNTNLQVAITNDPGSVTTNLYNFITNTMSFYPGLTITMTASNVLKFVDPGYSLATSGPWAVVSATTVDSNSSVWANDLLTGNGGFGAGPYRMYANPEDGTVWVTDATDGNANIFMFGREMEFTNKVFAVSGRLTGEAVLQHGNVNGVAIRGSLAKGNLQIFTADNDLPVPSYLNDTNHGVLGNGGLGNFGSAQETVVGDQNEIYRYDIGAGPLPCTNTPVFAATLGLDGGFGNSQVDDVGLGTDPNLIYATFRRANYSDGNLQVFRKDTGARVYTSLSGTPSAPADVFGVAGGATASGSVQGDYAGPRISPDGRFIAVMTIFNRIAIANLTNGIPDESSVIIIPNAPNGSGTGREIAWDAADNLYSINNNSQNLLRCFSLGISTTCITSNDITGTHGSFQLLLPPATVSVTKNGDASQNYGTPIAGKFAVNLGTNTLAKAVTVNFAIGGTATNGVNYNIATGSIGNGVSVVTNADGVSGSITFPAATYPGAGNWTANITVTPTASPAVGPTLTVSLTIAGGTTYFATPPLAATVRILNTGPQFFFISAAPTGTTMTRAIPGDYAQFVINRWGDLNGPGNTVGSVNPTSITLKNFTLAGTAAFPADYTAGVQIFNGASPVDGMGNVTFNPGDTSQTVIVGNPVSHANVLAAPTNATIIPSLTNSVTGTNGTSLEGYPYIVNTATTTLTEFDNAEGTTAEVVLWSDPLTNSSAHYAITFASTNLANHTVPPVYIPNYSSTIGGPANGSASGLPGNQNNFDVQIGFPIASESDFETSQGVGFFGPPYSPPPSPVMVANSWSNVLRMTVNKQQGSTPTQAGLNLFPTTNIFYGNYALRFDMYLSIWSGALNNFNPLSYPRQFAAFGINTLGTNCDWRLNFATNIPPGTGSGPTNSDGMWYCIDAADQSLTPADFDAFVSPGVPNAGTSDFLSGTALTEAGVFKRPPFPTTDGAGAGTPINQWVNVNVETRAGTNVAMYIDGTAIFPNLAFTNHATAVPSANYPITVWTNGTPMLGYLQPYSAQSDESAFVYFSNVRVVELSPYVILAPTNNYLILPGVTNLTFNSAATYATAPLTNGWYSGATVPTTLLQPVATTNGTNLADSVTLTNVTTGTAIFSVYSDPAGSVTSFVAQVEVVKPQTNAIAATGGNGTFTVTPSGPSRTTSPFAIGYLWKTNGVALANGNKYQGVTNVTLTVSNCQVSDTLVNYTCTVTNIATNFFGNFIQLNQAQSLTTPASTLSLAVPPTGVTIAPPDQTNVWGSKATFTASVASGTSPFTYSWQKGATKLAGASKYSGTNAATLNISNLVSADAGSYTVTVTNLGGTNTATATLTVLIPPPSFTTSGSVLLGGGNVTLAFGSTNTFDKTNSFVLQSSPVAQGPYTNTTGVFTTNASGFQVTVPQAPGSNMFYRLLHNP